MRVVALLALLTLAACAPPDDLPPQLRKAPLTDARFPELAPLTSVLSRAAEPGRITARTGPDLTAEAEALRTRARTAPPSSRAAPQLTGRSLDLQARAAALRRTVMDSDTGDATLP